MPKLIIDDCELEVPTGTRVIEAAERLGIKIPRFCYHEALGSVGACRMCAVKFVEGPVKGLQMSCMVDAQDGMVVSTNDPEAVAFRKYVIELLMLNHPHDCPVCDEGGQCLLQDMTVSGGHELRRFLGRKRTYRDQKLGVFIAHEMNRCIHCYRCSRFYQEFTGYRDLGPLQIANRVYFGRFEDGQLESPFSGNLVDLCPTGVFTDKPARYKGRRWDFERAPSLCLHCSLGCNTIANARYRAVVRVEARFHEAVNGYFICDRGRFGFSYASHPERPRRARVDGIEVALDEACQTTGKRLMDIEDHVGGKAIACLGSLRSSLETLSVLKQVSQHRQWREPDYFADAATTKKVRSAIAQLDRQVAVSLRQIEAADFLLAVGVDPINEAPMLALAMRQAQRREAAVVVIDPRPISLPFAFDHLAVPTWEINRCFASLLDEHQSEPGSDPFSEEIRQQIKKEAARLRTCHNSVLVCGTDIVHETTPAVVGAYARSLLREKGRCGLFYDLPGANAFGAGLLASADDHAFQDTIEAIERGEVKALIVVECDPLELFPDRLRLERALARLELLLVIDYVPSPTVQLAHIMLPALSVFETGASFINQEGRLQFAQPVYHGGTPVSQASGGGHPPRVYTGEFPGGEPKPAWQLLTDLAGAQSGEGPVGHVDHPLAWAAQQHPLLTGLQSMPYPVNNLRCLPDRADNEPAPVVLDQAPVPDGARQLQLLLVDAIYGSEELSQYSEVIQKVATEPCLAMHIEDASRLGFEEGETVSITLDAGTLETTVRLFRNMAPGTLVLPRHRRFPWLKVKGYSAIVPCDQIKKVRKSSSEAV